MLVKLCSFEMLSYAGAILEIRTLFNEHTKVKYYAYEKVQGKYI